MSALTGMYRPSGAGERSRGRVLFPLDRFVLPKVLRRPARIFARMGKGDVTPPPFSATILSALLIGAAAVYGASLGGQLPGAVQAVTARTGFAVDRLQVTGHRETSEIDVIDRLGLDGWTSLIGFDPAAARERIAQLPWVSGVAVRKVYPDTLEVKIEERAPYAIWQHDGALSIVERSGDVITEFRGGRHASLPLLVGVGAVEDGLAFVDEVRGLPEIARRIKGYIRVAGRRWDVRLDNGVTVRLPERGEMQALRDLIEVDRNSQILSRDIAVVDMRFPDRLIVRLTPEGVEQRQAALDAQEKAAKAAKAGKRI